jgi:MFS transporter, DHA1 family, inner membrane transport protein
MSDAPSPPSRPALPEASLLLLLAAVQFTHIMDFMVMMPLGPQLMRELDISSQSFGNLISAFAISAGLVGLLSAPHMDRFDRRKVLLFCYAGFALGTLACGLAHDAHMLMFARILCGAFGGVSGATVMAIVSDVIPPERRARGMGIIMTAFSVAAALGVPFGLWLAQQWKWEAPFFVVAGVAVVVWIALFKILPPVRSHLENRLAHSGREFLMLLKMPNAWRGLALILAMVLGHFMIIPYLSTYLVRNLGMPENHLFLVYLVGGLTTIFTGPLVGRLADRYGRFRVYCIMIIGASVVVRTLTSTTHANLVGILFLAAGFFIFASGRFVPGQAAVSLAVPRRHRGAYMSLVACSRDLCSGFTAWLAGCVVQEGPAKQLVHYDLLGLMAVGISLASIWVFWQVKVEE